MKLLCCRECAGIFNLAYDVKTCACGKTQGAYLDSRNAIYAGPCVPLGFDNMEFVEAVQGDAFVGTRQFDAFVIPATSRHFRRVDDGPS